MVVRTSVTEIAAWDDLTLGDQEQTVGRFKFSGASLDLEDKPHLIEKEPAYATNPDDARVALSSHTRKTGPRRLVFICFGRTISTQFEFMVRAWMNNPPFPYSQCRR